MVIFKVKVKKKEKLKEKYQDYKIHPLLPL